MRDARPAKQRRRHQADGGQDHQPLVLVLIVAPEDGAEEEDGEGRDVAEGNGDEVPGLAPGGTAPSRAASTAMQPPTTIIAAPKATPK